MKVIVVGAAGTIGENVVSALKTKGHQVLTAGRSSGDYKVDMESEASVEKFYKEVGSFDALCIAGGKVAFAPLEKLGEKEWASSFNSKLMGQIRLVQQGASRINDRGSFTLIAGILGFEPILGSVAGTTVNKALEGFVMASALELPRGIRINLISPTLLTESVDDYKGHFEGFIPVPGAIVGQTYVKSVMGIQTGQVFRV